MRYLISFFLILLNTTMVAHEFEQIKEALAEKGRALAEAHSDEAKSRIHFEIALANCRDQELDVAFVHFLEALKNVPKKKGVEFQEKEREIYEEALSAYLAKEISDPVHVAQDLLEKYGPIAQENPEFIYLNFLIATAYANIGKFEEFFTRFYKGYPYLHHTFLAAKTEGILYLRLSHHGKTADERQHYQEEAFRLLVLAHERNLQDANLYKVLIFLAKDAKNERLVDLYLQELVKNQVELPRADICFYVREAVLLKQFELGQKIIDRASELYSYSRAISESQEYLNQHRLR